VPGDNPGSTTTSALFISLPPAERDAIREKLLQAFLTEKVKLVLNKISDAVAEVARQHTEEGRVV
jgi:importin-5